MHFIDEEMLSSLHVKLLSKVEQAIAREVVAVEADVQHSLVVNIVLLEILQHECGFAHSACSSNGDESAVPVDVMHNLTNIICLGDGNKTAAFIDK